MTEPVATRVVADDDAGRSTAIEALRAGAVVGLPTDTVYGIAVALGTAGGVERLFAAKDRPPDKAIMVLADGPDQVEALVEWPPAARALAGFWPGGLTLVLPLRPGAPVPPALTAGTRTLGVRIPDHPAPRALARALGPLPTTSANRSGEPAALDAPTVATSLAGRVALVLDGGPSRGGTASTVVDCSVARPVVLRPGAIAAERLAAVLEESGIDHALGAIG
ncbi:MAG TPA: L-threonylcarbamoyladenylate synthase [Candidatus Limnocylindrales bacterium]|nr:L-threonylcarbamoyladenylate synthase [Candidatus Limnocylindrales bacterium]